MRTRWSGPRNTPCVVGTSAGPAFSRAVSTTSRRPSPVVIDTSVWPGALFFATAAGIANYVFPLYLTTISDLDRLGGQLGLVIVALLWFYAVSLGLLAGAVINSLRHEHDDTGQLPIEG